MLSLRTKGFVGLMLLLCLAASGCTTTPKAPGATTITPPIYARERMALDDVEAPLEIHDPFEAYNRSMYWFNAKADDYVLNPAVAGYQRITPAFVRRGVTNFFQNLDQIPTLLNQVLQLKWSGAWDTSRRLVTNSTIGIGGVMDVATRFDITRHDEDFGQTLGHYGVGTGPYIMLPLFGPSNVRDALGRGVDTLVLAAIDPVELDHHPDRRYPYYPLLIVDTRANTAFQYYETGSPFEYELVRLLFSTMREFDVAK